MKKTLITLVMLVCFSIAHGNDHHKPSSSEIIAIAMSAAPANVSGEATIMSADGSMLREGNNGWTCMPGTPPNDNVAPMCVDQAWQKWLQAYMTKSPYDSESESFGLSYMLLGDIPVDNDDPNNQDKSKGTWVAEGPHLMMLLPESLMANLPTDPYAGGPYVMWKGSDYVHVMVPLEVTKRAK